MIYFMAGVDTGVGKTTVTGLFSRCLREAGKDHITAKIIQTGCEGISEDIRQHRLLAGGDLLESDRKGLTCPEVLPFPGSPHLAARLAGVTLNPERLLNTIQNLGKDFPLVLCEGAGGLMVPLDAHLTLLDLLARVRWPTILVTTSQLGSLNHTLLSVQALQSRQIPLAGVIYTYHPGETLEVIQEDSFQFLTQKLNPVPVLELRDPSELNPGLKDFVLAL